MHVGIIGAGIAGLSCAWQLKQQGIDVTVFESRPYIGGLARSFEWHGFSCDFATHRLFSTDAQVIDTLREMTPMHTHRRKSQIYFNKSWISDPLDVLDLVKTTSVPHSLAIARSFLERRKNPDPRSFREFVEAKYGFALYDFFFRPYTEKLFGIPGDEIDISWAKAKVRLSGPFDRFKKRTKTKFDQFYYPKSGGYGAICQNLFDAVQSDVKLASGVTRIETLENQISRLFFKEDGAEQALAVDAIVSTVPINVTGRLLGCASQLEFRPLHAVYLLVDKRRVSENHWVYFMDDDIAVNRMVEFKNMSDVGAPQDTTVLCAEITNANSDLAQTAINGVERAGLLSAKDILDSKVLTEPFAYPVYRKDYELQLAEVTEKLAVYDNLFTLGRGATFTHFEVDDNFGAAQKSAKAVIEYLNRRQTAAA